MWLWICLNFGCVCVKDGRSKSKAQVKTLCEMCIYTKVGRGGRKVDRTRARTSTTCKVKRKKKNNLPVLVCVCAHKDSILLLPWRCFLCYLCVRVYQVWLRLMRDFCVSSSHPLCPILAPESEPITLADERTLKQQQCVQQAYPIGVFSKLTNRVAYRCCGIRWTFEVLL